MGVLRAGCVALGLAVLAMPIPAQPADTSPAEAVSVNISDLEMVNDLAGALRVEVGQIPVTVQAPIQLAATVCGVTVKQLRSGIIGGMMNCDATTTSPAFIDAVEQQLLKE